MGKLLVVRKQLGNFICLNPWELWPWQMVWPIWEPKWCTGAATDYYVLQAVSSKRGTIGQHCIACGHNRQIDMRQKVTTFIVKNPPVEDATAATATMPGKKTKRDKKGANTSNMGDVSLTPSVSYTFTTSLGNNLILSGNVVSLPSMQAFMMISLWWKKGRWFEMNNLYLFAVHTLIWRC